MKMSFYLFEDDALAGAHVYSAMSDRKALFSKNVTEKLNVQGASIQIAKHGKLCDRLFSIGKELVLSKKASALLTKFKICPYVESLPVLVVDAKPVDDYLLWYSLKRYDAVDRAKAMVRMVGKCLLSVREWVLDPDLIPDYDLFYVAPNSWIMSEKAAFAFNRNQFTGAKLTKLKG